MSETSSSAAAHAAFDDDDLRGRPIPTLSAWEAFKFGFTGPGPVGLLLGLLSFLVPVLGMVVLLGWLAETNRRIVLGKSPGVRPFSFNELGEYLKAGVVSLIPQMAIGFVVTLPLSMVMVVGMMFAAGIGAATQSPALMLIVTGIGGLALMALAVGAGVVIKAVQIRAELTGDLSAAFDVQGIKGLIQRQWKPMVAHSLLLGLLCVPAMFLGLLAFFVGVYVVAVATQFMLAHLRAQIYIHDVAGGGERLAVLEGNGAKI